VVTQTYGWSDAERDLAAGVHAELVSARLGEPIAYLLEVADAQGWCITWDGTPKNAKWIFAELDA
jgi:hypothetical protein